MPPPEPALPSRRRLLELWALLALPWGCVHPLPGVQAVNLDALGPDDVLLLGRIRLTILGLDCTGDAFVRINAAADEMLLPSSGEVAWVVRRPPGRDIELTSIESSGKTLYLHRERPILAPHAVRTAINYFGTVDITLDRAADQSRDSGRVGRLGLQVVDESARDMAAFVAKNHRLAGRMYYHVLRRSVLDAPPLSG